ncbi:MAG: flagellar filament capping protein FliD [Christensenellaceae bacterium]
MIGSVGSTTGYGNYGNFNLSKIGNVHSYASGLVKNYLSENSDAGLGSVLSGFLGTWQSTRDNTVTNTLQFANTNVKNLNSLKSASSALNNAARALGNGKSSLISSDDSVVKASATYYSNANLSFDVNVSKLATAQKSESASFASSEKTAFSAGVQNFNLQTEKGSFNVSFYVGEDDTNKDTLTSIADSINASDKGVTAEVVTKDGKSSLAITSDETGEEQAFSVSSADGSDAAQTLAMSVSEEAGDSSYTVNGQSYTSASNTVSIPNGRGATMTLQGEGEANLTRGVDASKLVSAAQNFASAYNTAVSHLMSGKADGAGVERALSLVADNRMTAMSIANYGGGAAGRLSAMGISIDEDGKMAVDAEALTKAAQENPLSVQNALSGYGSLSDTTTNNVTQALRIPTATYTDFSKMKVSNSLIDMLMPKTGSLFDFGW